MQLKRWQAWLLSIGVVAIFVAAYAAVTLIKERFWWDAPSEELTAVIAGLVAATLPVALLWDRITGFELAGLKFNLAGLSPPAVEVSAELSGAGSVQMGPSFIMPLLANLGAAVNTAPAVRLLTLNIDTGPVWWSTRVFLVAALAHEFTGIEQIVFLENCAGPDDCFIGNARPAAIVASFAAKQPFLADAYQAATYRTLDQAGYAFTAWFDQEAATANDESRKEANQQTRVTKGLLREWLGRHLIADYVEWRGPVADRREMLEIAARPEQFVALVRDGRLKLMVDREAALRRATQPPAGAGPNA